MTQPTPTPNSEACPHCTHAIVWRINGHCDKIMCRCTGKKPSVCPTCGGTKKRPCITGFHRDDNFQLKYSVCPGPFHTSQAPMPGKRYVGELFGVPIISDPKADKPYMRDRLTSDPMPGSEIKKESER